MNLTPFARKKALAKLQTDQNATAMAAALDRLLMDEGLPDDARQVLKRRIERDAVRAARLGKDGDMSSDSVVASALAALAGPGFAHAEAVQVVKNLPGIYAFYGDDQAWIELDSSPEFEGQPLYVGKAE